MPEAEKKAVPQAAGTEKEPKEPKAKKEPNPNRSNFSKMWPEDANITLLVKENPKKEGSKAKERFQHYFTSKTVGDYLAAGGTYQDIAYDNGRMFIKIG